MTGDNLSSRTCSCPPRQWITTCDTQVQCMCMLRQLHTRALAEERHNRAASSWKEGIIYRWYSFPREMKTPSRIWCTHQKVHLHSCIISTRRRDPKHVSVHTYRRTWQVLCELLPLMWQAYILNHLVHLNFHFIAAASFQPRIEVDVLLHRQPAKVEIISWAPSDWQVKASPATYSQVFFVDKWPKMPD